MLSLEKSSEQPHLTSQRIDPMKQLWNDVILNKLAPRAPVRSEILNSWQKCLANNLDPLRPPGPPVLGFQELNLLREQYRDLLKIAEPAMKMIEISVRGSGFLVTLTDKKGYVLEVKGDKETLDLAEKNYYEPGCLRSSDAAGTNAIALAIEGGRAIQITGAEHYNINHHPWTCSSAPIRGANGDILSSITLSGQSTGKHKHTLALVMAAANMIEAQIRERNLIEKAQRLNCMLTSIHNSISDGFIALDNQNRITHLNSAASKIVNRRAEQLIGACINEIIVPDTKLTETLRCGEYSEATEIRFKDQRGSKNFMCRMEPIYAQSHKLLGNIIILVEKRQMITIAKKIGGNYAKYEFSDIVGSNIKFLNQIELAKLAAQTNSRILILGESGTGKELFAQAIHSHSHRSHGPFVAISCAAIPRDLIESEMFGYKGGAFTGARQKGMIGKFELANGGTLFLDEINGLPLELQGKLLRVLQQNEIVRLGDTRTIPIDVRVIAASNTDLMKEVEDCNFREDLYYRLNVMEIFIPPLRERMDDLEVLVHHIMDRHCLKMGIDKPGFSSHAIKMLKTYLWPGNVRELENAIERALLLCQGKTILKDHLSLRSRRQTDYASQNVLTVDQSFKDLIRKALRLNKGNVSKTASDLNIARSTLYRKMEHFGIQK